MKLHHYIFKSPILLRFINGMALLPFAFQMRKSVKHGVFLIIALILLILMGFLLTTHFFKEGFDKESKIPNRIWTYWDGEIPPFVQKCIESWHKYNPEYHIVVLNKQNLSRYLLDGMNISELKHANESSARFSDYVRLLVVPRYGGIWMDASIICQHSLDWVHNIHKETGCEFVGYYREDFTTIPENRVVESWFFACVPESKFVQDWRDEFLKINNHDNVDDYVNDLKRNGIQMQNVPEERLNYLAVYLSAQAIMQKNGDQYKLQLIKSDYSALKHWIDRGFHSDLAAQDLVKKNSEHRDQPIIKIVGVVREELLNLGSDWNILFD